MISVSNNCEIKKGSNLFIWILNVGFHFPKEFFSNQWAKISCYRIFFFWRVIKNGSSPVNYSTHETMCARHTIASGKHVFPIRSLHTYLRSLCLLLQDYCQRHIQEYISWNMNWHKPRKSTTGMMLLSVLRVQDNNILAKWYEETTGICFECLEDGDMHIPSQSTCSHFCLWVEVPS